MLKKPSYSSLDPGTACLTLTADESGFEICFGGLPLIRHSVESPCITVARADLTTISRGGFFEMDDHIEWQAGLGHFHIEEETIHLGLSEADAPILSLTLAGTQLELTCTDPGINRFKLHILALPDEAIWGGGEQFSHLNLRGRTFPLWVAEPGVGRDPEAPPAKNFAHKPREVGDYWTTYYPQPTYMSSRHYALHLETSAYAEFDFTSAETHTLSCKEIPAHIELFGAGTYLDIVSQLSARFGRQPQLPDWAIEGAIVGLKDGHPSFARIREIVDAGTIVTGLWCEDWAGIRQTAFGRRLFWDWQANDARFPNLKPEISKLEQEGIRFLAYINPYLATDGDLFDDASARGFLVKHPETGGPYVTDFGGFECGHIDLTNPEAVDWVADQLIGAEMMDIGIAGWMADFGEYLPVDAVLHDGSDAHFAHNEWPVLWAQTNARAVENRGKRGETVFFMRSGFTGVGAHCPLLWAGDQSVDFSRHDGIETTIRAALSSGLLGNAYHHSDIGGYTSLFGNVRSACLQKRWAELAAFTPVMRTHEGNRPEDNLQIDSNPDLLSHFARMTRVHARLAPYTRALCEEAELNGWPLQRPLFLHFPDDPACYAIETQYLYGADLLVAPVLAPETKTWRVYLPPGETWVHLWSHTAFDGGQWIQIAAPFGEPPVFYRQDSQHADLFASLAEEPARPTKR